MVGHGGVPKYMSHPLARCIRPIILADRGFARASFLQWLHRHQLADVARLVKGTCLTERDGRRWKLGEEALQFGQVQCALRLTRLLMAFTLALTWLSLLGLPAVTAQPVGWHATVAQRGRASIISLALAVLDHLGDLLEGCVKPLDWY